MQKRILILNDENQVEQSCNKNMLKYLQPFYSNIVIISSDRHIIQVVALLILIPIAITGQSRDSIALCCHLDHLEQPFVIATEQSHPKTGTSSAIRGSLERMPGITSF